MRRFLAAVGVACLLAPVSVAGGATLPPGFQEDVVLGGLVNPTVVRFSPDGRVFVAEKSGLVKVFDSVADTTPTIYADLRTQVHNYWDRGLLGMALDPQFPADPYVYVLYTRDSSVIGGAAPRWGTAGATSDPCPNPPGGNVDGCVVSGRLSRLNAEGQETALIDDWCQQYPSHSQGQIQFGPDGMLYATSGDGAAFSFADWGQDGSPVNPCGDPPGGVGAALTPPTAEGGALRAQDLRTSGDPVTLDGSLIRVNPDNGFAPPTNPLFSSADLNARRIVMHGFRNPFRVAFRPGTSELWIGDVGLGRWEEINRVTELLGTVENGGWPCYEGPARPPSFEQLDLNICESLYAVGPSAVLAPYYSYSHSAKVVANETCPSGSSSLSGLAFYQGGDYPAEYDGALFFADYSRDCIWAMRAGANGLPNPSDIVTLVAPAAGPVSLEIGPGGDLFYTDFDGGTVRRIRYFPTNQPPVAVAQATPSSGIAPLEVSFDGRGSSDPDGDTLTYAWDLDGDGQYDDSTSPTPSHTYTQDGAVTAGLRVSDLSGASDTDAIVVTVGNTAPVATIGAPSSATTWAVGESVAFAGSATDPQGPLPAYAYHWELVLHHCPSTCHEHLVQEFTGQTGAFDGPNHDYPAHLELRLTLTDDGGLTDVETVSLQPKTVQATFATTISGLQLTVDDDSAAAPFTRTFITGSTHTAAAPATQTLGGVEFTFVSWSNGAPRLHQLTPTTSATYTAEYSGGAPGSCTYNPATRSVAAAVPSAGQATLKVVAGAQILFGAVPMPCAGATSTNTDTVLVTGTHGTPERLTIDESEAPFGPGATAESNTPEIEVVANLGDAADQVAVIGTSGADRLTAGANGLAINADNDVDITFAPSPPPAVDLSGGGGVNVLTARGGTGTGAVFGRSVVLRAGSLGDQLTGSNLADFIVGGAGNDDVNGYPGNDTIEGGGGNDKLNGADGNDDVDGGLGADTMNAGAGDDTMRAVDGVADTALSGGAGTDTAYYDLLDPVPTSVEIKFLDSEPPPPPPPPDTTPPETTITSGPTSPTTQTSATLAFSSNETGSTFECALDLGSFLSCTSPVSYSVPAVGGHEVRIRATDPAGNVDPTPASFTWTIETPPDPPPPPPPPPPELGACTYSAAERRATAVIPAGATGTLAVVGSEIRFADVACGAATTANTDTVAVNGSAGSTERLVVDQSQGALAPGATVESVGSVSEIELALALGDAADELVLGGTPGADLLSAGTKGVSFNADTDLDVTFAQMLSSVELVGGAGVDTLTARGGYGTAQVFLGRVTLRGDDGDDALSGSNLDDLIVGGAGADTVDGNSGNDEIHGNVGNDTIRGQDGNDRVVGGTGADNLTGGNGDDTIDAADGEADAQIHGQIGVDTAYYDSGIDPAPFSVENLVSGPPPMQLTGLAR
jgi:glucose/arabinose dehydrogenase/Ca2+-binding RTX toxin-like protein